MIALFVPGNRSHVETQLPVAEELRRRGHEVCFLTCDGVVREAYHTKGSLEGKGFTIREYDRYYETDIGRRLPRCGSYFRSRRAVFGFLDSVTFDVAVTCNDDSGLFDRLVAEYCRRRGKDVLLIQESVRAAQRRLPLGAAWRAQGRSAVTTPLLRCLAGCVTGSAFARRGYGHSDCTMIAAAGDRFRRQLIAEGVPAEKIRVTGQPRLDGPSEARPRTLREPRPGSPRVLLFCNQPIPVRQACLDRLFLDLVSTCNAMEDVRLIVKLHPRDMPEEHWRGLVPNGMGRSLQEVTRTRPLAECFAEADAMVTVASTTSLEAMAAGLPVALVNYLPTAWYLPYHERGAAISISSQDTLKSSIQQLLFDASLREKLVANSAAVLTDELYLRDGRSAERIADFIEERVYARSQTSTGD